MLVWLSWFVRLFFVASRVVFVGSFVCVSRVILFPVYIARVSSYSIIEIVSAFFSSSFVFSLAIASVRLSMRDLDFRNSCVKFASLSLMLSVDFVVSWFTMV